MGKDKRRRTRKPASKQPPKKSATRFVLPGAILLAAAVAAVAAVRWSTTGTSARVDVSVPATLSAQAETGERAFEANCAQCHGRNAAGTDQGPPLVHDIYNPGHHADAAFYLAAQRGVFAHHWNFGDMPPQPGVGREELAAIVQYVRELQHANGITYKPHRM